MFFSAGARRIRCISMLLAVVSVFLLGCAHKLQIEIPADFRGNVHITCTSLTEDHTALLRITGPELTTAACPAHRADVVVTRSGETKPVQTNITWMTTGDGLVREILFDVK